MKLRDVVTPYVGRTFSLVRRTKGGSQPFKLEGAEEDYLWGTDKNGLPHYVPYVSIDTMLVNAQGILQVYLS